MSNIPDSLKLAVAAQEEVYKRLYYEKLRSRGYNATNLNEKVLSHCIKSFFLDIGRTTAFHEIDIADRHKKAAYAMKWIVKTKPIQINPDVPLISRFYLIVNEIYAVHYGLNYLNMTMQDVSGKFLSNLIYTLHYRPIIGQVLASKMYLLECAANKKTP
jgi:hypothetical protein